MIFDSVQEMMVGHLLRCALIKEVLQSQKSLQIEDRVRETRVTNDRQQLFKAFKIHEAVSCLAVFQLLLLLHMVN